MKAMSVAAEEPLIVAGDLNSSETFDLRRGGPRGNREIIDRMNALGFYDCLRMFRGEPMPCCWPRLRGTTSRREEHHRGAGQRDGAHARRPKPTSNMCARRGWSRRRPKRCCVTGSCGIWRACSCL